MIDKAREHFRSAEILLFNNQFRDAASRAYYAIYSATYAVVGSPPQRNYWTHQGIRKAIVRLLHEERQDDISMKFNKDIDFVYDIRVMADYQISPISEATARDVVNRAQDVLNWAVGRLGK